MRVGRLGLVVWAALSLVPSLTRQAASYGPIGGVFALFSALLAAWPVLLAATLVAEVLTDPEAGRQPSVATADSGSRSGLERHLIVKPTLGGQRHRPPG